MSSTLCVLKKKKKILPHIKVMPYVTSANHLVQCKLLLVVIPARRSAAERLEQSRRPGREATPAAGRTAQPSPQDQETSSG